MTRARNPWGISQEELIRWAEKGMRASAEAELEALRRDAKRWRAFNQRMARRLSPTNTAWKLVEVCPMYGEEKEIRDWREQIEAVINMPANGEGGEK